MHGEPGYVHNVSNLQILRLDLGQKVSAENTNDAVIRRLPVSEKDRNYLIPLVAMIVFNAFADARNGENDANWDPRGIRIVR